MKKIVIGIVVILLIIIALSSNFLKNNTSHKAAIKKSDSSATLTPTQTVLPIPTTDFDESTWITYTVKNKFSIKYPPTIQMNPMDEQYTKPPTDDVLGTDEVSTTHCNIFLTIDSRNNGDTIMSGSDLKDPSLEVVPNGYRIHHVDTTCGKKTYFVNEYLKKGNVRIRIIYSEYVNGDHRYTAVTNSLKFINTSEH